jgi:predicted component of type VI protein secretion system
MATEPGKMMRDAVGETSVLVAEVTGAAPLAEKLGAAEAARAVDRALARAERSIQAYAGSRLPAEPGHLTASFPRSDSAALAANDMIKRISQLPPVSGVSLAVRVVLHAGVGATLNPADMEVALGLLPFAAPGQILVSNDAVSQFSEGMRANLTSAAQLATNTAGLEMPLVELQAGNLHVVNSLGPLTVPPPQPSIMPSSRPRPVPASAAEGEVARTRLLLRYHGASLLVSEHKPVLLAGREEANDLVVTDRRASRQHARIEWRHGHFVLIDSSTNGTYLVDEHGVEVLLKRGECELPPHGRIGFGYSPLEAGCEPMVFDIGERQ